MAGLDATGKAGGLRPGRLDPEALEQVVSKLARPALALARRMLPEASLAEDAVQEALLRVVRWADRYRPSMPLDNWFYAIVRNVCRDMLRRRARQARAISAVAAGQPTQIDPPDPATADVRQFLNRLGPEARTALTLRVVDGLSFREVAAAVGISEEAAKKRAQRALRRLRDLYRAADAAGGERPAARPKRRSPIALPSIAKGLSPPGPGERTG